MFSILIPESATSLRQLIRSTLASFKELHSKNQPYNDLVLEKITLTFMTKDQQSIVCEVRGAASCRSYNKDQASGDQPLTQTGPKKSSSKSLSQSSPQPPLQPQPFPHETPMSMPMGISMGMQIPMPLPPLPQPNSQSQPLTVTLSVPPHSQPQYAPAFPPPPPPPPPPKPHQQAAPQSQQQHSTMPPPPTPQIHGQQRQQEKPPEQVDPELHLHFVLSVRLAHSRPAPAKRRALKLEPSVVPDVSSSVAPTLSSSSLPLAAQSGRTTQAGV